MERIDLWPDITAEESWMTHSSALARVESVIESNGRRDVVMHIEESFAGYDGEALLSASFHRFWFSANRLAHRGRFASGERIVIHERRDQVAEIVTRRIPVSPEESPLVTAMRVIAGWRRAGAGTDTFIEGAFHANPIASRYALNRLLERPPSGQWPLVAGLRELRSDTARPRAVRVLAEALLRRIAQAERGDEVSRHHAGPRRSQPRVATYGAPIFVIGSPRSGTSILTWCLGQHPNILPLEETGWFVKLALTLQNCYELGSARGERSQLSSMRIGREEFFGEIGMAVNALIARRRPPFRVDLEDPRFALLRRPADPKRRWVDGTPEYSHSVYALRNLFPDARFIHILRDVRAVVPSMLNFSKVAGVQLARNEEDAYQRWLRAVHDCVAAERAYGSDVVLRVRYRDLLQSARKILRRCLVHAGEAFTDDCLLPLTSRINSSFVPEGFDASDPRTSTALKQEAHDLFDALDAEQPRYAPDEQAAAGLATGFLKRAHYINWAEGELRRRIEKERAQLRAARARRKVLMSFCNARVAGLAALALFDPVSDECQVIELPSELDDVKGITGLALSRGHLFAVAQCAAPRAAARVVSVLLVFDLERLTLLTRHPFVKAVDVHSIVWREGELFAVSTGTDEIVKVTLDGHTVVAETVFWRHGTGQTRENTVHLNAAASSSGRLLVSGFGRVEARRDAPRDGFILDLDRGELVATALDQPHTLLPLGGQLLFCESRTGTLRTAGATHARNLPGYARGMCAFDSDVLVATSVGRSFSRSSGAPVENPRTAGLPHGRCTINRFSKDWRLLRSVDLTAYASEIYDLLVVGKTDAWPTLTEVAWRDRAIVRLSVALDERKAEIRRLRK